MALAAAGLGSDGVDGAQNASISAAEKKLYDRQLRVWGLGAQQRLMQSCLLFLSADGILSEVLKNLVLAGVGKVILVDRGELISAHDLETNFLLADAAVGATKIPACRDFLQESFEKKELNPLVKIRVVPNLSPEALAAAQLVFSAQPDLWLSRACLETEKAFYLVQHSGKKGFCFTHSGSTAPSLADFLHSAASEAVSPIVSQFANLSLELLKGGSEGNYVQPDNMRRLYIDNIKSEARGEDWGEDDDDVAATLPVPVFPTLEAQREHAVFAHHANGLPGPLVSVAAILGGVIAQEAMKAITLKDPPLKNCIFHDMDSMSVFLEEIGEAHRRARLLKKELRAKERQEKLERGASPGKTTPLANGSGEQNAAAKKGGGRTDLETLSLSSSSSSEEAAQEEEEASGGGPSSGSSPENDSSENQRVKDEEANGAGNEANGGSPLEGPRSAKKRKLETIELSSDSD